jgi:hypothetical protein
MMWNEEKVSLGYLFFLRSADCRVVKGLLKYPKLSHRKRRKVDQLSHKTMDIPKLVRISDQQKWKFDDLMVWS